MLVAYEKGRTSKARDIGNYVSITKYDSNKIISQKKYIFSLSLHRQIVHKILPSRLHVHVGRS
jgi:hypothetical protein